MSDTRGRCNNRRKYRQSFMRKKKLGAERIERWMQQLPGGGNIDFTVFHAQVIAWTARAPSVTSPRRQNGNPEPADFFMDPLATNVTGSQPEPVAEKAARGMIARVEFVHTPNEVEL